MWCQSPGENGRVIGASGASDYASSPFLSFHPEYVWPFVLLTSAGSNVWSSVRLLNALSKRRQPAGNRSRSAFFVSGASSFVAMATIARRSVSSSAATLDSLAAVLAASRVPSLACRASFWPQHVNLPSPATRVR